jgi:hypothetical protein
MMTAMMSANRSASAASSSHDFIGCAPSLS